MDAQLYALAHRQLLEQSIEGLHFGLLMDG